ncbi:2,3-bisphosphoglycerate-independent phosphoglycerate mutase [soil metagenome]
MDLLKAKINRPVALVILDGWGYAPRTEGNAIAMAHTPYYDEICRNYPMTTLAAAGSAIGQGEEQTGNPEIGHLNIGAGRVAQTDVDRIRQSQLSGEFMENAVLNQALAKAKADGAAVHLIGLVSDAGIHSSTDNLFAILRIAKHQGLRDVFVHCILDGLDVPPRTADIYVEALEIKLADIGVGRIATLCGRFFAMDKSDNWERTARAFTLLAHGEGERAQDAVSAVRNSFLRGISDEFISPIILEKERDVPVATVKNGDLVIFFNHRADAIRQLVRSLSVADGSGGAKPVIDTVCLTEYDPAFGLSCAFRAESESNTLAEILKDHDIPHTKITETARLTHLTHFFDGGADAGTQADDVIVAESSAVRGEIRPESQSFKITDKFRRGVESSPNRVFVVNIPAADLMAETGDIYNTVAAIQFIDTCIEGICEKVKEYGGVVMITSTHGNCEEMMYAENGEPNPRHTLNPVPFHYVDDASGAVLLKDGGSLSDIAPTILGVLDIEKPEEMTGTDIRSVRKVSITDY